MELAPEGRGPIINTNSALRALLLSNKGTILIVDSKDHNLVSELLILGISSELGRDGTGSVGEADAIVFYKGYFQVGVELLKVASTRLLFIRAKSK